MKIKNLPEAERPVEKILARGASSLSNCELIAILLGTGTHDKSAIGLAYDILAKGKEGITFLGDISLKDLIDIPGIGKSKAATILASVELGKRIATTPREKRVSVCSVDVIAQLFLEEMRYEKKEIVKLLLLSKKTEIIAKETVSIGTISSSSAGPREVFNLAIRYGASAIILVHNHPSGDPTPSITDYETTKILKEAGDLLGIKLLDHVIIGDGKYVSMINLINNSEVKK